MDIIPPVIVVQGADMKYYICEQRMVVNGIPVYHHTGFSFDTVADALREAEDYRRYPAEV